MNMIDDIEISKNLNSWEEISWEFLNQNVYDSTEYDEDGNNPLAKEIVAKLQEILSGDLSGTVHDKDNDFLDKIYLYDPEIGGETPEDLILFCTKQDEFVGSTGSLKWVTVWEKDYADTKNQTYHYIKVLNDYPETLDYLYMEIGLSGSPNSSITPFFVKARMS